MRCSRSGASELLPATGSGSSLQDGQRKEEQGQEQQMGSQKVEPPCKPASAAELRELSRVELYELCDFYAIDEKYREDKELVVAMLALRGSYGKDGKAEAVTQVRRWINNVDEVLREVGILSLEGPTMSDVLNAKCAFLKNQKRRRMKTLNESDEDEEDELYDQVQEPVASKRRFFSPNHTLFPRRSVHTS